MDFSHKVRFFAGIGPAHFLAETTRPLGRGCLHFHLLFIYRMAMGTKKMPQLSLENCGWLPHRDSNSVKQNQNLVCYHYTMGQSNFFAFLRAQRYGIILTFPNFSGKIFRICTQFVWKCYVCCSKLLGSPCASMTLMT